jgi:DNA-binding GntR family transcriptional regulator
VTVNGTAPGRRAYENLEDEAAGYIRRGIVSGEFPARSKVDQDEVAEALGISRAPVREALIELAQKGFVDAVPRRGAFVAELTAADIEDYYEVVAAVFGLTTRRAVSRLSAADVAELRRLQGEAAAATDTSRRQDLGRQFFNVIAATGRSPRLDSLLQLIGGMFQGSFYLETPGWQTHEADYQQRLLGAVESGDERQASRISEEYLLDCGRMTVDHLRSRGYWAAA